MKKSDKVNQQNITTNHLNRESSPYLHMHAKNPVDWYPWGQKALKKAEREDKLIIISIGYAACHWCHVMEKESFSNMEVAEVMNKHFISIKVDREERPDIDQIYMDAAHLLTGSGGWPLNAIALPDGRPVFAGTYFKKKDWISLLNKIREYYSQQPDRIIEQAEAITRGIATNNILLKETLKQDFSVNFAEKLIEPWQANWDTEWGGTRQAPKFPMPIGFRFLLIYHHLTRRHNHFNNLLGEKALNATLITLDKMAFGGIYDQAGGGFARYSTDEKWKIPHFEKMLYDNGQLVSLYAFAFQLTKKPLYKSIVYQTLGFVEKELLSPELKNGGRGFYSSLDADSEGIEGKYYVWTKSEFDKLLGKNSALMADYYNISKTGNWEKGLNILFRTKSDQQFCLTGKIKGDELNKIVSDTRQLLLKYRQKRKSPPLDDKILTGWNGLMLTGYIDAYRVFGERHFLDMALENANFITNHMIGKDHRLNRSFKGGKSSINAFLEDYAFTIQAFISLYQATFDEKWLFTAKNLLGYTLAHFFNQKIGMFYYTSDLDKKLISRKFELDDNVIPASNSQMAHNLYLLGEFFFNGDWIEKSRQMLANVKDRMINHGPYSANWGILSTYFTHPPAVVAIVGEDWESLRKEFDRYFLPRVIFMGGPSEGNLPLLKNKLKKGQTTIYVCHNKTCQLPVTRVSDALFQIFPAQSE